MARAEVRRVVAIPADALWARVADFGNVGWMKPVTRVEVEGEGPGMVRAIYAGGPAAVRERLEAVDAVGRTLVYTIPENNPLPVAGYRATVRVSPAGAGECEIAWACEFEPKGTSEDQARTAIEGMYGVLIGWITDGVA